VVWSCVGRNFEMLVLWSCVTCYFKDGVLEQC